MITRRYMIIGLMLAAMVLGSTQAFDSFFPFEVATGKHKTPAENLGGPWYQDGYGPYFGTSQGYNLKYDATDARLELGGTGNVYIQPRLAVSKNATSSISTTFTELSLKNFIPIDASGGTKVHTLPWANNTTVIGSPIFIGTAKDPGSYYASVKATGGDKIGGAGGAVYLNTTSAAAGLTLLSDGDNWIVAGAYGTWA